MSQAFAARGNRRGQAEIRLPPDSILPASPSQTAPCSQPDPLPLNVPAPCPATQLRARPPARDACSPSPVGSNLRNQPLLRRASDSAQPFPGRTGATCRTMPPSFAAPGSVTAAFTGAWLGPALQSRSDTQVLLE